MGVYVEILREYIFNNQLVIDKGTYLTIVIGQITVYAILLTFYQFIVSFQGSGKKTVQRYMGRNLVEYYVYKRLKVYNWVVSKKFFGFLFVLEILYKPILAIYGEQIPDDVVVVLNFLWYLYVVFFFVVFVLLFFQCTRCILSIKAVVDKRDNRGIIRRINREFRKKTMIELWKRKNIELLMDDMKYIRCAIAYDDNEELIEEYTKLIIDVWDDYQRVKESEINLFKRKKYETRNQAVWIYNMRNECWLLDELVNEKYIKKTPMLKRYIIDALFELLELNLQSAQLNNHKKIAIDGYNISWDVLDCREWKKLLEHIFKDSDCENKKRIIDRLQKGNVSDVLFYREYCENLLRQVIRNSIEEVFEEKLSQKDFVDVFECIRYDCSLNEFFAKEVCENLIYYNKINANEMITLLSKENSTYIFVYLIIYYSVYKFRFEWEYVNVSLLKELVRKGEGIESQYQRIDTMISDSRMAHRYYSEIYIKLLENIKKDITGKWLEEVYQQDIIDAFYITVIKMCVFEQEYNAFYDEGGIDAKLTFINELVKHDELLACENIRRMITRLQFNDFKNVESWPSKLDITFRALLLLDMDIPETLINDEIKYCYYVGVGEYLLVKDVESKRISSIKKGLIRKAYVASDMSLQKYVEFITNECTACGVKVGYVKQERMKNLLAELL